MHLIVVYASILDFVCSFCRLASGCWLMSWFKVLMYYKFNFFCVCMVLSFWKLKEGLVAQ